MPSNRGLAFSAKEDEALCYAWFEVSEDPVMESNQKEHKMWEKISIVFHNTRPSTCLGQRTQKSLACRWSFLASKTSKFRACIRQIEQQNLNDASELDILNQAKILYQDDPKEKKGFLFDHVWNILKNTEKWIDTSAYTKCMNSQNIDMSQTLDSKSPSQRRTIDLNTYSNEMNPASSGDEETATSNSINRPTGRKKEKKRRKKLIGKCSDIDTRTKENEKIIEILKKGKEHRANNRSSMQQLMKLQLGNDKRKLELQIAKQDHDIMMIDLDNIKGTPERQYFRQKKQVILNRNIKKPLFHGSSSLEGTKYGGGMYGGTGYEESDYGGDQHRGPRFGEDQHGRSQYGGDPNGGSQFGRSQYRESQYSGRQYGREQYERPQFGGSHYGGSDYGAPEYKEEHGRNAHGNQSEPKDEDDLPKF